MIKSRDSSPDYGDMAAPLYYSYSGGCILNDATYMSYLNDFQLKYAEGHSKAITLSGTRPIGSQTIESTTRGKPFYNHCTNIQLKGYNYPYLYLKKAYNSSTAHSYAPYMRSTSAFTFAQMGALAMPSWAACDALQREAWWTMQPRFESEISMLNFIFELKDFKEVLNVVRRDSWANKLRKLKEIKRSMLESKKNALARTAGTVADASKVWSDLWLANSFALQPLIKDVTEIFQNVQEMANVAQEKFRLSGTELQTSHFSRDLSDVYTGTWGLNNTAMIFTGARNRTRFTATMEYKYNYSNRSEWELQKRYWGLNMTTGVIWEAIPFSFLVDYFYKVGNAIHMMERDPNVKSLTVNQYCESLLSTRHYGIGFNAGHALVRTFYAPSIKGGTAGGFYPLAGVSGTIYVRRVTSPNKGTALPRVTLPTKGQGYNILALVRSIIG